MEVGRTLVLSPSTYEFRDNGHLGGVACSSNGSPGVTYCPLSKCYPVARLLTWLDDHVRQKDPYLGSVDLACMHYVAAPYKGG
jgi:hypothetical protein